MGTETFMLSWQYQAILTIKSVQQKKLNSPSMLKQYSVAQNNRAYRHFDEHAGLDHRHKKEQDDRATLKRRVSCDLKTLKRTDSDSTPRRKTKQLQVKLNYKLSSDVISFVMDEQRNHQMKIIQSEEQLNHYYIAFKKLFLILFQASHFLMENMFKLNKELYNNKQVVVVCLLFEKQKKDWTTEFLNKMMVLARNVIFMASSPAQFQKRIDMVARKVTMQSEKKARILAAFLNPKIQRVWEEKVEAFFPDESTQAFIDDQFDSPEQKMCFLQIKQFVLGKLSTQNFGYELRKYGVLEEIDEDINLDFKFEFLLTEEFSFNNPDFMKKQSKKLNKKESTTAEEPKGESCAIM